MHSAVRDAKSRGLFKIAAAARDATYAVSIGH